MTVDQIYSQVVHWAKRIAGLGLLIYIVLFLAKTAGYVLIPGLAFYDPQATGVLVAGIAYALGRNS